MLRKIRIFVSVILFVLITGYFLDFAGVLPDGLHWLEKVQFLPALLALNWIILAALLVVTLVFGRVYCSSVCPLGVYQDIVSWLRRKLSGKKKRKKFGYKPALTLLRWSFAVVVLIAFLTGFSFLVGLLDPYSAYGRMTVHLFRPAYMAGNNLLTDVFTHFGNHTFYRMGIYLMSISSLIIALVTLAGVGVMAWTGGRIYCNSVCPVGTVLGFFSRYSLFRIRFDDEKCNSCGACAQHCKASCIDFKVMKVDGSRCVDCFDCIDVCKKSGLSYRLPFAHKFKKEKGHPEDESKRRFLSAVLVSGVAATQLSAGKFVPVRRGADTGKRRMPVMPPGAGTLDKFSRQCTSCHLCVSKCPSGVIKPSFLDYGIGGMMQPMLDYTDKFCNYDCSLCSEVCPSGALTALTRDEKHHSQIGVVQFVIENCIVYKDETSCGACSEHCPTQAVGMKPYKGSLTIPVITPEICVGCGGCESICPARPYKAIFVEGVDAHQTIELVQEESKDYEIDDFGF